MKITLEKIIIIFVILSILFLVFSSIIATPDRKLCNEKGGNLKGGIIGGYRCSTSTGTQNIIKVDKIDVNGNKIIREIQW